MQAAKEIEHKLGFKPTVINPLYLSGIDYEMLNNLKANHGLVITLEDGCISGGFGEKISRFFGNSDMRVLNFGADKEFTDRIPVDELYKRYHLTPELILQDVLKALPVKV